MWQLRCSLDVPPASSKGKPGDDQIRPQKRPWEQAALQQWKTLCADFFRNSAQSRGRVAAGSDPTGNDNTGRGT